VRVVRAPESFLHQPAPITECGAPVAPNSEYVEVLRSGIVRYGRSGADDVNHPMWGMRSAQT
jgi:hypothetical protein